MSDELPDLAEWRHDDEPNWERLGFEGEVCRVLGCPPRWQDEQGYEHEITAGAVSVGKGHVAWVECRQKKMVRDGTSWLDIEYRLKGRVEGRPAIDWVVETYNPYFGCRVGYMAWHGERVVMVYREKHDTYACSVVAGGDVRLMQVAHRWRVVGGTIEFCRWRSDRVERLSLSGLEPLAPLEGVEARMTGLLWGG